MEKKDFKNKLGKIFTAKLNDGQTVELKLAAVDPSKKIEGFDKARKEPFSLVFTGPKDKHLPDNSYLMSADGLEDCTIFISAFKEDEDGIHYDSVFN